MAISNATSNAAPAVSQFLRKRASSSAPYTAMELARFRKNWLTAGAALLVAFEIATVLILRAHYTMDVFTGIIAALWISHVSERVSPRIDQLLAAKR